MTAIEELFDIDWYSSVSGILFADASEAIEHYLRVGADLKFSPSPYIDEEFYRSSNEDVDAAGVSALEHYVKDGDFEGRRPSPLFDSAWYREKYQVQENTLLHYIRTGYAQGHLPGPVFCSDWYAEKYRVKSNPLLHYIINGHSEEFSPNPVFDAEKVAASVKVSKGESIFAAYIRASRLVDVEFSALFDAEYYRRQCELYGYHANGVSSLESFLNSPIEIDCHSLFSRRYYRSRYIDNSDENELVHFMRTPQAIRDPHPFFSTRYYFEQRPDVRAAGVQAVCHYMEFGSFESTNPHPLFDAAEYKKKYADINFQETNPLIHYIEKGFAENRSPRSPDVVIPSAKRAGKRSFSKTSRSKIVSHDRKIGVFAHVYFIDLIEELVLQVNFIPGSCRLFITTDSQEKKYAISVACREFSRHPFEVRVTPNRGRDIAPMLIGFQDRLMEVDLALHIHTKKSSHYKSGFDSWRSYLLKSNLGSTENVLNIINIFNDGTIGAVAPVDYPAIEPLVQWGGNLGLCKKLIGMMTDNNFSIGTENPLELPSGSMFWFDPTALNKLIELPLDYSMFDPELGQVDGTLAHAIERSFFYIVELAGRSWVRFKPSDEGTDSLSYDVHKLLPNRSGEGPLVRSNPEIRPFTAVRSDIRRPRLNLLIPTAERQIGYAGVSEALRLFDGLAAKLGSAFDLRIIGTVVPFSNQIEIPTAAKITSLFSDHADDTYCVTDGTKRISECLSVREQDIFIATAWMTAVQVEDLIDQQSEMFQKERRKYVYLIQDYECGFYPWSTRSALAEGTYKNNTNAIKIVNTQILADFFISDGYFRDAIVYNPPINERIRSAIVHGLKREKIVLAYMRPAAPRNCLEFANAVIDDAVHESPEFWKDWRFIAIGEDFDPFLFTKSEIVENGGRLTLNDYADLISRASVGLSFMVSPHPSYPPLEMAAAGMKVITNKYANKDLSDLHTNIHSFDKFDVKSVSRMLKSLSDDVASGLAVPGRAKADWFFDGKTNIDEALNVASEAVRRIVSHGEVDHGEHET
ncbi:rhamnan synthesis F family protein [Methylobacterium flocculans]|uniref:rhamnan synthesis F family protein n=1 Tax=Methylobacterium flocculans TaxID=2984843 RepID=UPI0021F32696|nr:rhamnan synthesis F family protein [Methylobacterium sp. FF17]